MVISFIVPAYNEEFCLAGTLNALHAAGLASNLVYEIIVADDASTDRTAEIALQNNAVLVSVAHRQIAATRNAGAKVARGDWFIFSSTAWGLELNNLNKLKPCPKDQMVRYHNCWGTYNLDNGNKYLGEFQHGKRNGQGTLTYVHGDKYVGEFKDGNYHGRGIETYVDGSKYFGEYKGGKRNSQCTHTFSNGKYVGEFRDDDYNGQGTFTFADGGDLLVSGKTTNPTEEELKLMQMEVLLRRVSLRTVSSFGRRKTNSRQ